MVLETGSRGVFNERTESYFISEVVRGTLGRPSRGSSKETVLGRFVYEKPPSLGPSSGPPPFTFLGPEPKLEDPKVKLKGWVMDILKSLR